jgi:hypothetical protein
MSLKGVPLSTPSALNPSYPPSEHLVVNPITLCFQVVSSAYLGDPCVHFQPTSLNSHNALELASIVGSIGSNRRVIHR